MADTPRQRLVRAVMFAVDGYVLGEWDFAECISRVTRSIHDAPIEALEGTSHG